MPEAQIPLAMATLHIALAPKSNSSCAGISTARAYVKENPLLPVPHHLKDSHYPGAAKLGNGTEYLFPHDYQHGYVQQNYLPIPIKLYKPTNHGVERELNERLTILKGICQNKKQKREEE
jgi:putative ATPase